MLLIAYTHRHGSVEAIGGWCLQEKRIVVRRWRAALVDAPFLEKSSKFCQGSGLPLIEMAKMTCWVSAVTLCRDGGG